MNLPQVPSGVSLTNAWSLLSSLTRPVTGPRLEQRRQLEDNERKDLVWLPTGERSSRPYLEGWEGRISGSRLTEILIRKVQDKTRPCIFLKKSLNHSRFQSFQTGSGRHYTFNMGLWPSRRKSPTLVYPTFTYVSNTFVPVGSNYRS